MHRAYVVHGPDGPAAFLRVETESPSAEYTACATRQASCASSRPADCLCHACAAPSTTRPAWSWS
jgi:hypothetical protein